VGKPERLPPLSDAQLEIMNVFWQRGEATVGELWQVLAERRKVARNTVQTLIVRLKEKGWLRYRIVGNTQHFRPAVPLKKVQRQLVRKLLDLAFDGSTEGLVMTLLETQSLDEEEAKRIRKLLDEMR
jgi:predicted transcriptional regulator